MTVDIDRGMSAPGSDVNVCLSSGGDASTLLTVGNALPPGPGMKSGGGGKADMDGTVDVDDPACETTRSRLSSELEYELGESEKLRAGDWFDGEGLVASFREIAGGVPSSSAGSHKVSSGDCNRASRGGPRKTTPVPRFL